VFLWFAVFAVTALADTAWTLWMLEAGRGNPFRAALWGAAIVALGAFTTVQYIENHWIITATISGGFVGTYCTVRFNRKKA
jgi:hypothetical protein